MNATHHVPILIAAFAGITFSCMAQPAFDSGSDGSMGDLNITENMTLDMPADGVFHFKSITLGDGVVLRFNPNPLHTPVYLLSQGEVKLGTGSAIILDGGNRNGAVPGKGAPGGFDGGYGSSQHYQPGDGLGPGGGRFPGDNRGRGGVFGIASAGNTRVYGNTLLVPLIGGSGGAGGGWDADSGSRNRGGGAGGGAILIAANSSISFASGAIIYCRGGHGGSGGSGGAIRVVAPVVAAASGSALRVDGGASDYLDQLNGHPGRTRIDTLDRQAWRGITLTGKASTGTQMFVFPAGNPALDIVHVAGREITDASAPLLISLPVGTPTNQVVRVRATGFSGVTPITVQVTPENGPSASYDDEVADGATTKDVAVVIPVDVVSHIHAWTR